MNIDKNTNLFFTKEGNGNDVLFLHGWGCNSSTFCAFQSRLKEFNTIAVDLYGFGNTPLPIDAKDGLSVEYYADKIADFIKNQNLKNLSVIGHSFGGRIAIVLCAKYPQLVSKLVLISSAGLNRFSLKKWLKIKSYKLLKLFAKNNKKLSKKLSQKGSADYKACNDALRPTFLRVINQPLQDFASKIACDTLLIWGNKDKDTPLWMAKRFNKIIKKSGLVIIKNTGHFCFLENSNLVLAVLKSFLKSEVK